MRRLLGGVVAAVALVAGACGGGGTDLGQVVRAAATTTTAAESSRVAVTAEVSGERSGTVTGVGAFDYGERRGTMTMQLPGLGSVDAVFDGLVFYMKLPTEMAERIPGAKSWIRFDLEQLGEQAGVDVDPLTQASQGDPTQALQYLRGASDDVTEVGTEDVRGVETTHYRATLDLEKAKQDLGADQRKAIDDAIVALGTNEIPTDVWIDHDGRARRLTYTTTKPARTSVTIELFDFGVEVDASPPPGDQVADLGALLGGQAG